MDKIINSSEFKKDLERAKKENKETFIYKGDRFLVSYAEYLVEYMAILEKQKKQHAL
jgi:mRNA-degrading endonuclease YafQ of YafQ-DinJ toxin-antitoxin module